jgi:hypothetical protein
VSSSFKIIQVPFLFAILFLLHCQNGFTQEVVTKTLINADKLYINRDYSNAVNAYLMYLEKYPRDYYAERQTALCFTRLNIPDLAIDHWPIVVESSEQLNMIISNTVNHF